MIDFIRLSENKDVWHSALHVSLYCRTQKTCDKCIFFDEEKRECIFLKSNKYGLNVAPEDWEV